MNKMIIKLFSVVLLLALADTQTKDKGDKNKQEQSVDTEQAQLDEFFGKYCNEKDEKVLAKLEKCESIQPPLMKKVEQECIKKILKTDKTPTYKEIKKVECDDKQGVQFDDCQFDRVSNMTLKKEEHDKLKEIAKKIMHCGFDCYGIKHD